MSRVARRTTTLVTGPATEPVTAAEAMSWARLDDDSENAVVTQLITAARMSAEEYLRRSLVTQTWKLTLDLTGNGLDRMLGEGCYDLPVTALYGGLTRDIELPRGRVQSISLVTTYDISGNATTFPESNYYLDAAGERLVLNFGSVWPANMRPRAACEITYVTGYGDTTSSIPQPIKTGMLIHVASMYEQRGQSADALAMPPGTAQLYNQYRIMGDRRG